MKRQMIYIAGLLAVPFSAQAQTGATRLADNKIVVEQKNVQHTDDNLVVGMTLNMDSLELRSNQRLVFTPIVRSLADGQERTMPQIIVNGRKQDISYKRYAHKDYAADAQAVRRKNGTQQSYDYFKFDKYKCGECGEKIWSGHKNYFGPTKLALSVLYIF